MLGNGPAGNANVNDRLTHMDTIDATKIWSLRIEGERDGGHGKRITRMQTGMIH